MKYIETRTSGEELWQRLLLQQILQKLNNIETEQVKQGKAIARIYGFAAALGAFAGAVVAYSKTLIGRLVGSG